MLKSLDAARAICEFGEWKISNLELQKILYISHGSYMAENGGSNRPLIDGIFCAWDYGPVEEDLYYKFRMFAADRIKRYALELKYKANKPDTAKPEIAHIKKVYGWVRDYTAPQLISMTHADGGAWEKYYDPERKHVVIPNSAIFDEYKRYGN